MHAQASVLGLPGEWDGQVTWFHGPEILCWDWKKCKWVGNIYLEISSVKKIGWFYTA